MLTTDHHRQFRKAIAGQSCSSTQSSGILAIFSTIYKRDEAQIWHLSVWCADKLVVRQVMRPKATLCKRLSSESQWQNVHISGMFSTEKCLSFRQGLMMTSHLTKAQYDVSRTVHDSRHMTQVAETMETINGLRITTDDPQSCRQSECLGFNNT